MVLAARPEFGNHTLSPRTIAETDADLTKNLHIRKEHLGMRTISKEPAIPPYGREQGSGHSKKCGRSFSKSPQKLHTIFGR